MTTATRKRAQQPSSCPEGYVPSGHVVPLQLTVKQQTYCRRAVGIARFVYNLCVATHQFCRTNRLPWPSWQDLNKAINEAKHEDFPFVAEVSKHSGRRPKFKKKRLTATGSFRAASGVTNIHYDGKRRIRLTLPRLRQTRPHAATRPHLRNPHLVQERPVAAQPQLLETASGEPRTYLAARRDAGSSEAAYPPQGGYYYDPDGPEERYLWRWACLLAPDLVIEVRAGDSAKWEVNEVAEEFAAALDAAPVLPPDGFVGAIGRGVRRASARSPESGSRQGLRRHRRSWTGCGPCWRTPWCRPAPASSWTGGGPGRPSRLAGR